eukprot:CAMPEP_0175918044 /NCGR_PEP_ID=MMETSP0108-20121206/11676_1 /TAXON_ID=195067 ORGANISM="Goniomonas pacifica, Strain CCMP1869" /NCGR_SAMPLE_ID=MMETSP0108 /ASSEMBLY_ACC=CAM_ASM_000204 /LENGTH=131 /DNA_ID=CAMNT_0017240649 /DNA_START=183 /DNA_END=574 /DNA_ORIENTATION=-
MNSPCRGMSSMKQNLGRCECTGPPELRQSLALNVRRSPENEVRTPDVTLCHRVLDLQINLSLLSQSRTALCTGPQPPTGLCRRGPSHAGRGLDAAEIRGIQEETDIHCESCGTLAFLFQELVENAPEGGGR